MESLICDRILSVACVAPQVNDTQTGKTSHRYQISGLLYTYGWKVVLRVTAAPERINNDATERDFTCNESWHHPASSSLSPSDTGGAREHFFLIRVLLRI